MNGKKSLKTQKRKKIGAEICWAHVSEKMGETFSDVADAADAFSAEAQMSVASIFTRHVEQMTRP